VLFFVIGLTSLFFVERAGSRDHKAQSSAVLVNNQLVVSARRTFGQIEYTVGNAHYSKTELSELIGEAHLNAKPDSAVVFVLEDSMALSDIKEVPEMALAAGFKNVRVFVYWKGTGNMAELFFGPVVKHSLARIP
jgi:hypothetical protein